MIPLGDVHTITTFDGKSLYFPTEVNRFLVYGNYGAPPTEYITRRGYKQDGATEVDYSISQRDIIVQLWRKAGCNRIEYWQNRANLHDFLRPNRGGPIELTLIIPNGTKRSLLLRANPGATFPPTPEDNTWHIDEALEFVAHDPIWYNPEQTVLTAVSAADAELVFPIDFPIWFGAAGSAFQESITYIGTWKTYPVLTINGPYNLATIENLATNVAIYLTVPTVAGETRVITLTPGNLSIVDQNGVNKFGELGPDSNLVDFNIRPDPEVPGGVQVLRALLSSPALGSSFTIAYNERYYAI